MGLPFSLRNSLPSGAVPNRSRCSRSMTTSSGGTGTLRAGLRVPVVGRPLVLPFSPRCSCIWPSSVYARPAEGLESANVR